jgi:putative ABC transport system permease protein
MSANGKDKAMKTIRRLRSLFIISAATLRHEWLPSLCLVTALAAVLCPVVLILGLKHGTVENLRQGLLRDPANLEIRLRSSMQVDDTLLAAIRALRGAGFLIPKTRSLGSAAAQFEFSGRQVEADLYPTAPGDPLLETYHCRQPGRTELVLTASAAQALVVGPGDEIVMFLSRRTADGRSENVSMRMTVRDVLPVQATTIKAAYVQLPLLSAVEQYRDGLAVPWLQWSGPESKRAEPVFDGFLLVAEKAIPVESISRLSVATGFLRNRRVEPQEPDLELARAATGSGEALLFYNESDPQPETKIQAARDLVDGGVVRLLPWSKPREIDTVDSNGTRVRYSLRSLMLADSKPPDTVNEKRPWILVSNRSAAAEGITLRARSPLDDIAFPCQVANMDGTPIAGVAYAPPWLTGVLCHLDSRVVEWNDNDDSFLLGRRSFAGFRLYARDLLEVQPLAAALTKMGIDCSSEADKVARVLKFDKDLSVLFWMVSTFSLAGGGAALALSLYGAIERRRRDYAMLRTLGLPRSWLVLLPLFEGIVLTTLAFTMAILVYHVNAAVINRLFANLEDGRPGFCFLPFNLQALVFLCTVSLSIFGVLAAAIRLLSMNLSEAIRHA